MAFKELVSEKYNSAGALRSPAHITLHMPFEMEGKKEERLLTEFSLFKPEIDSFNIQLKDFGFFAPRVVFVNVEPSESLMALKDVFVDFMKRGFNVFNQSDDQRGFHPHITIGFRDLRKPQFYQAMEEFSEKKFEAAFKCEDVCLLKHDGKRWHIVLRAGLDK